MPDAIPLLRAGLLLAFVDFLKQIGAPTDRLLRQSKLSLVTLAQPESLLPLYPCISFVEAAARLEGIPNLGLLAVQQIPTQELGTMGRILSHSLTLFDLLVTFEQIVGMINSGQRLSLRWEKDWVWVQHNCFGPADVENWQSQQTALMVLINAMRMALGPTWQPPEIQLVGVPCRAILAMDDFSAVQIHFQCANNTIKIPRALLSLPLNTADGPDDLVLQPDYEVFRLTAPAQDFVGSLRQLIRLMLPQGYPDVTFVAAASGKSVRSLQRQLAAAGLSYSRLVDQVRFDRAVNLLKQPEVKLIEIAAELGYTDSANFTRAFKRWTSTSPREFRQLHHYQ
jgi:AraC-like DNA-binding protein